MAGLGPRDFMLTDNGGRREFQLEEMNSPVSLVVAVETATTGQAAVEKLRKSAPMIEALVAGYEGEVALIGYDSDVRLLADFSGDGKEFGAKLRGLRAQGGGGRMHDAAMEAARLLAGRVPGRRRVLMILGESKDLGSKASLVEAANAVQESNVTVYASTWSRMVTPFTNKEPATVSGGGTMDLLVALQELGRLGQADSAAQLTKLSGGLKTSFTTVRGLESALGRISSDLHWQYLLTFVPQGATPGQARMLNVSLPGRPEAVVRHRQAYWVPGEAAR
jgi:VWFA-related protein